MNRSTFGTNNSCGDKPNRRRRRPKGRQLFCPKHPEQLIQGNGKKYYLHLLSPVELERRGISSKKARLIINAYPVLVLSTEWLEELYCPQCGCLDWFHVVKHDSIIHSVYKAPRELWKQVAHVDSVSYNPTVGEFTRNAAKRNQLKRPDGNNFYDRT